MAYRKRRRSKVTWFPVDPTVYNVSQPGVTWFESSLTFPAGSVAGDTAINAVPLTLDETQDWDDGAAQGTSLRDIVEGQDYMIQRVVGKVWMQVDPYENGTLREAICAIGLAVLPSSNEDNSPNLPAEEWNPLFARNSMQPWLWRRTWRLDNRAIWDDGATPPQPNNSTKGFPGQTSDYGDRESGGHLDSVVRRRVTKEHRLYIIAAAGIIQAVGEAENSEVWWGYDLRVLGGMRRARNSSSF